MLVTKIHYRIHMAANKLGLLAVCAILLIAFYEQFFGTALPCPLCQLQRMAFVSMGCALCLNLNRGPRPANYGLLIFSALFGFCTALRQIFLHILPEDSGFGDLLFGHYAYTWNAVLCLFILVICGIGLMLQYGFVPTVHRFSKFAKVLVGIFVFIIFCEFISAFLLCGFTQCPDNPTHYKYLIKGYHAEKVVHKKGNGVWKSSETGKNHTNHNTTQVIITHHYHNS